MSLLGVPRLCGVALNDVVRDAHDAWRMPSVHEREQRVNGVSGQFVEFFPKGHEQLVAAGVVPDTEISKGPSETYQFWVSDPDGNKFEVIQFTDKSYQVVGHVE